VAVNAAAYTVQPTALQTAQQTAHPTANHRSLSEKPTTPEQENKVVLA
jgi:hypothetical protein